MFRGESNADLNEKYFSVGSIMRETPKDKGHLIVGNGGKEVHLLSLSTFQLVGDWVNVEDPNWISVDEARNFSGNFQCTFSDYDYDAKGLK